MSKWIPKLFCKRHDGGKNSGVIAYFLIEWKALFSIALLKFEDNSTRENWHSHAFHAITFWLKGLVIEERYKDGLTIFFPSFTPKITPRNNVHRIVPIETTWALSIRGPWKDQWIEVDKDGNEIKLTHGRKII